MVSWVCDQILCAPLRGFRVLTRQAAFSCIAHAVEFVSKCQWYRYLSVPKELLENPIFSRLDYGAIILFAKMLERASLSAQHEDKFTDESGRLFIIYTVEQMEKDLQRSIPKVI